MRQASTKTLEYVEFFTRKSWEFAKNPVGTAIIGAFAGAGAGHLFSKSKMVQDLESALSENKKLETRIIKLDQ